VRRSAPWALLVVLVVAVTAGALLGVSDSHKSSAATTAATAATAAPAEPLFVGMTVGQALELARSRGVSVRIWRLPASMPAGTVMQQVSEQPVFLVVSDGPPRDRRAVLPQAVGPPVHAECAPGFRLDADGNAGPATCQGDAVNVATWDFFAASKPPLLALGRAATECEVARAYDDDQLTAPMNFTVFELASAYYGWTFGSAFTDQLAGSGAQAAVCAAG
jgi:hypothetical protein